MRGDRRVAYLGFGMELDAAMEMEYHSGLKVIESGETTAGAGEFAGGKGKHGEFQA
ncbi:MAG: enoyl-CoA hydratase, partial [Gemmatimonadetes bacterium]|nr:enoyl-CoA hydratase [Gemmatimonadota bacterium]